MQNPVNLSSLRKTLVLSHRSGFTWRQIAEQYGVNPGVVFRIARRRYQPKDPDIRTRLGLAPTCPECHRKLQPHRRRIPWSQTELADLPADVLRWMFANRKEMQP